MCGHMAFACTTSVSCDSAPVLVLQGEPVLHLGEGSAVVMLNGAQPSTTTGSAPQPAPLDRETLNALRMDVQACWNIGGLDTDAQAVSVTVGFTMAQDAKPDAGSLELLSYDGGNHAAATQAYQAARRAILRCGIDGYDLPSNSYAQWREIKMTFNPARMRIK